MFRGYVFEEIRLPPIPRLLRSSDVRVSPIVEIVYQILDVDGVNLLRPVSPVRTKHRILVRVPRGEERPARTFARPRSAAIRV